MDDRSRRFAIGIGVAWLVFPLVGGLAGLGAAFAGLVLPFIEGDYAQLVGCGVVGTLAGAVLATVHTVWSYWKTFLR